MREIVLLIVVAAVAVIVSLAISTMRRRALTRGDRVSRKSMRVGKIDAAYFAPSKAEFAAERKQDEPLKTSQRQFARQSPKSAPQHVRGLIDDVQRRKADRRKHLHDGMEKLFGRAQEVLADDLVKHQLMIGLNLRDTEDEFGGVADYGTITVLDTAQPRRFRTILMMDFGLGWIQETGEEVQFVIRREPTVLQTVINKVDDLFDFGQLLSVVAEELDVALSSV